MIKGDQAPTLPIFLALQLSDYCKGNLYVQMPIKAALLSALVFPGVGHFFLKKIIPGTTLASCSFVAIYYLVSKTVERALQISEKIQRGEIPLDVAVITELVTNQSVGTETQLLNIATVVFVICWLLGIVDSYRVAYVKDKSL